MRTRFATLAFATIVHFVTPVFAQPEVGDGQEPVSTTETGDGDLHMHHNDIGLFVGGTTPFDKDTGGRSAPTTGAEYERRFSSSVGAMVMAEYVGHKHKRNYLFAVLFTYRLSALRLAVGPGSELVEQDRPSGDTKLSEYFVIVTRVSYAIHIGNFALAPTVGIDLIGDTKTNLIYGLSAAYGF